jgi:hypothetical protein
VARGEQLHGLVDDLPRDEPRDEQRLHLAALLREARERRLRLLALLDARGILVRIELDGDGVVGAEEERLRLGFQLCYAFFRAERGA